MGYEHRGDWNIKLVNATFIPQNKKLELPNEAMKLRCVMVVGTELVKHDLFDLFYEEHIIMSTNIAFDNKGVNLKKTFDFPPQRSLSQTIFLVIIFLGVFFDLRRRRASGCKGLCADLF